MLLNIIAGYATEACLHRITAVLAQHFVQLAIAVLLEITHKSNLSRIYPRLRMKSGPRKPEALVKRYASELFSF